MSDRFTDERIRRAFDAMPEAPDSEGFRARLLAVASLTSQGRSHGAEVMSAGLLLFVRGGGATLGFALGVAALMILGNMHSAGKQDGAGHLDEESAVIASMLAMTIEPWESFSGEMATVSEDRP